MSYKDAYRVNSGGSWSYEAPFVHAGLRSAWFPGHHVNYIGFRLVSKT